MTFFLTVLSNVSYAASIFLFSTEWTFIRGSLPYLIGSLGTVCFDFVIWGQFYFYGKDIDAVEYVGEKEDILEDDEGL